MYCELLIVLYVQGAMQVEQMDLRLDAQAGTWPDPALARDPLHQSTDSNGLAVET